MESPERDKKLLFMLRRPELRNKDLEDRYLGQELKSALQLTRPLALMMATLFLLFAVADFLIIQDHSVFRIMLSLRVLLFLGVLYLCTRLDSLADYAALTQRMTACKIFAAAAFLIIFALYEEPSLVIQSLGAFTLIVAFYVLPNRWLNVLVISLGLSLGFVLIALWKIPDPALSELAAVGLYLNLTVLISSIGSHQIQRYRRLQFLDHRELTRLAVTDELTHLHNRQKINKEMKAWVSKAQEEGFQLALIMFDIDNLKAINDSLGHLAGDAVLREVGEVILDTVRKTDIPARWGGDEFVLLLPNTTEAEALLLANRLKGSIDTSLHCSTHDVTCSFGIASVSETDSADSFLHRADVNMYRQKAAK